MENYNIVLRGHFRAKVLEMVQEFPYRKARVEVVPDLLSAETEKLLAVKRALVSDFEKLATQEEPGSIDLKVVEDFSEVVNLIAMQTQMNIETRQELLEEDNVLIRAETLSEILRRQLSAFDWTNRFAHLRPTDPNQN